MYVEPQVSRAVSEADPSTKYNREEQSPLIYALPFKRIKHRLRRTKARGSVEGRRACQRLAC